MTRSSRWSSAPVAQAPILTVAVCSGLAGLGYEIVWTQALAGTLGHEIVSVLGVLAAFFCGMALGAWVLHPQLSRTQRPAAWYAGLEVLIGLWALALAFLLPGAGNWVAARLGPSPAPLEHWLFAFGWPLLCLLPATFAMGATLPALERWMSRLREDGWVVGGVYGANTLGAALGVLLTTFLLAPSIGYAKTAMLMALVNLACAAAALYLGRAASAPLAELPSGPSAPVQTGEPSPGAPDRRTLLFVLFATGLLGIGLEVLVIRVLSQALENTVFTFSLLLLVFLAGTSSGAWLYHRFARGRDFASTAGLLVTLAATSTLASAGVLLVAPSTYQGIRVAEGLGPNGAFTAEVVLAVTVFLLPTLAMGALFSHLSQALRGVRRGIGAAVAANTLGGALAPLIFGVLLLPSLGAKAAIVLIAIGYLALLLPLNRRLPRIALVPAGAAAILLLAPLSLRIVTVPDGGELLAHRDGVMASVSVVSDRSGHRHLKVNDRFQMGGTSSVYSDRREGHIPLLLHPEPRRALFLGLGAGVTFAATLDHPGLEAEAVELVPEVVELLPYFAEATGPIESSERLRIQVADARRFVAAAEAPYDVVIADLFHPARDGAASLYTREHFRTIRARLTEDGLFCQWLPLYQMDRATLNTIVRTFVEVFPNASAWLAHYSVDAPILGLIGSKTDIGLAPDWLVKRVQGRSLQQALRRVRLHEPLALPGAFLGGGAALAAFAGLGPINTDDHPIVRFQAPAFAYDKQRSAADLLLEVVKGLTAEPDDILTRGPDEEWALASERLAAYWYARDQFIDVGTKTHPTRNPLWLLEQVQEPLLAILRTSPDFSPAYDPLLSVAASLRRSAPDLAWDLLTRVEAVAPEREDARVLKRRLFN
jgi:spermidine synthase